MVSLKFVEMEESLQVPLSCHPLDRELATDLIFPLLNLASCAVKAPTFYSFSLTNSLRPFFQFVGYKQNSSAPSHAGNAPLLQFALTDNAANCRDELIIAAVPLGPAVHLLVSRY